VPSTATEVAVRVNTLLPLPGIGIVLGEKLAVTPAGKPLADKATVAIKPPCTAVVRLTVVVPPVAKVGFVVLAAKAKPHTPMLRIVVLVAPPPVAVIVKG
jgi:hypothetical protein